MARDTRGLALGTEVRSRRADLKRRIKDGSVDLPALLEGSVEIDENDERTALDMPVYTLALNMPGVFESSLVDLSLNGFAFSLHASTRLAHLTIRQRAQLAAALRKEIRSGPPRH